MRIHRQITQAGLDAIKQREGLRLEAYKDSAGVWTIGYGHTSGVWDTDTIDEVKAEALLKEDVRWAETTISANVQVPLGDDEFAALVSWAFNVGVHNVIESTLVRRLNGGDYESVPSELMRWIKITDPATGQMVASQGLINRRNTEVSQWHQGSGSPDMDTRPPSGPIVAIRQGREDISKSRTMRGGAVVGAGTIAGSILDVVEQAKPQVAETMTFLPTMKWVFVALVLVGLAAVIYARLDDHRMGSR